MSIAARLFSMKYAARRCRTFKPLIAFSFCSEECSPAIGPVPSGTCAPQLLKCTYGLEADSVTAFAIASLSRSWSSRDFGGGDIKYAARAPLKALVSAAASLTSAVNASAPWRTKRCSRPASRPTTRTFLPIDSKESAMIEPVFPLAPKITYMPSVETAILSLRLFTFVSPFLKFTDLLCLHCAIQEKEHRDGLGAFVSPCVARTVLHDYVPALQMQNLAVVQLQPNLSFVHYCIIHGVRFVHRRIFLFEVIGQSLQTNQCFVSCGLAIERRIRED